jgi:hypothetical protein
MAFLFGHGESFIMAFFSEEKAVKGASNPEAILPVERKRT